MRRRARSDLASGPAALNPPRALGRPTLSDLIGADQYGRPILGHIIFGARNAMLVGIVSVLIGLAVGGLVGLIVGYLGGPIGMTLMRCIDGGPRPAPADAGDQRHRPV